MKHSFTISIGLLLLLIVWMALGNPSGHQSTAVVVQKKPLVTVEVVPSQAQLVTSSIQAYGDLLPIRSTQVLAETYGKVETFMVEKGERVEAAQLLVKLSIEDRAAMLKQAKAKTLEAKNRYEANQNLKSKGFSAQMQIDEFLASYEAAKAAQEILQQEIEQLSVRAPFSGIIAEKRVEQGDYIFKGNPLFKLIDTSSMLARVSVAQTQYPYLKLGNPVEVVLATGQKLQGILHFIAPEADENTKTFLVDILIQQTEGTPSGISVTAQIPKTQERAHFISAALLTLDDRGEMGVKTVNADNQVQFYPVTLVQAAENGIFVGGLPEQVDLIVTGQGFVQPGQTVIVNRLERSPYANH
ncbi:MAG: efflux RND transporter periplasmic adaptor subunit [Thiotrichales bacterium]|nr:efflux RND transporter periplasmic adaptor subunit [Thiotrichales bacterium]